MNLSCAYERLNFANKNIYSIKPHVYAASNVYHIDTLKNDLSKNVWLFDIEADPAETNDLSTEYPDVVNYLLVKLAQYNSTAVPCYFPPKMAAADPKKRRGELKGIIGPWM